MHMCDQREWFFREHIFPIQACISLMHWIWKWNERFWCLALFLTYRTKNFVLRLKQHSLVTSSGLEQDTVRTLHACISCFSHVRLFWTLWTVAHQAPLSTGFFRQEYWSGVLASYIFPCTSVSKESSCSAGDPGLIPGSGRSSRENNGNPFQYSCLENPVDRGAWWATVHGAAKSLTWLSG